MFFSVPPVHLALLCPGLVTLAPLLARAGLALRAFALPLGSSTHYSVAMCREEYDCTYAHVLTCTLTCASTLAHTALTRMHARSHSISSDFFLFSSPLSDPQAGIFLMRTSVLIDFQ